jgi:hypothetical protein
MKALMLGSLAAVWLLAAQVLAAQPEVVTQEATGEAAIVNGNRSKAEKEAKDQALRTAVEQVAGVMIQADTLTANNQLVSDRIYANTAGYVRKYAIVSSKEEGGVMKVTVKAEVGAGQIDKDLQAIKAMVRRMGNPKLVILLQEQTVDQTTSGTPNITSSGVMASVLTDSFKADHWTMVDSHFAAGKLKLGSGVGAAEAKEIGDLSKADYILYGTVNFRNQSPEGLLGSAGSGQKIFPVTGEYDLSLFATDSGSQLAKVSGKLVMPPDKVANTLLSYERTAFNLAKLKGSSIVDEVRKAVYDQLRSNEQNGNRLVMNVLGVSEYGEVQGFKKILAESVNGVREVRPGTFGSGKAQFDVVFVGSTDDFAEKLEGKSFKGKKLSVTGVTGNTIEVKLGK